MTYKVLSVDVVTPDGRFVTADESQNTELFWALRGGGASSYGVTVSWTVKVTPKLSSASVVSFTIVSGGNITADTVFDAFGAYLKNVPTYNTAGHYSYFIVTPSGDDVIFLMSGWFAPNSTVAEHQAITAPLFQVHIFPSQNTHWEIKVTTNREYRHSKTLVSPLMQPGHSLTATFQHGRPS